MHIVSQIGGQEIYHYECTQIMMGNILQLAILEFVCILTFLGILYSEIFTVMHLLVNYWSGPHTFIYVFVTLGHLV